LRPRAIIHVAGAEGAGKTAFIETVLRRVDPPILVARCRRDDRLAEPEETSPRTEPELRRYLDAGADGVALFTFPEAATATDDFFMTDLMAEYSRAVVLEGDSPISYVDLSVFVAPAPQGHEGLFVRRSTPGPSRRKQAADLKQLLEEPDGVAELMGRLIGEPVAAGLRVQPELVEAARVELLEKLGKVRQLPESPPTKRWTVSERYAGIELAQLAIVNVRDDDERRRADVLLSDLVELRQDKELFSDVLGYRGNRIPITAIATNLAEAADPGMKKAIAKVRRVVQSRSV
jgi:hypothetical protein